MEHHSPKDDIITLAKDLCQHKFVATRTNRPNDKIPFRSFDGGEPFGFDYNGISIEVHVEMVCRRVKGTAVFSMVPSLSIFGVLKDGRLFLLESRVFISQGMC